jgi:hypothetical protein
MVTRRAFLSGCTVGAVSALIPRHAFAQTDPAVVGSWSPRTGLPHIAIHSASIPGTDEIWHLSSRYSDPGSLAWTLDPTTGVVRRIPIPWPYDAMCGGGIVDDEGHIRVYGGIIAADQSAVWDPVTRTWERGPYMSKHQGAYYGSAARGGPVKGYPGGPIVVAFGRRSWMDIYDADDYTATELTRMADGVNVAAYADASTQYPRLMPLPNGRFALVGTNRAMRILDVVAPSWTYVADMLWGRRYEGTATSVGPSGYEFFLSGSNETGNPAQAHNEVIDMRTGHVREVHPPLVLRGQGNTQLLPDGTVLVIGGRNGTGQTFAPELYDHARDTVTLLAPTRPSQGGLDRGRCVRAYHSTCELLNDGRMLWAGGVQGTAGFSYEIFSPPYLFRGPRPGALLGSGQQVGYAGPITLHVSGPAVTRVTLLRSEHVSHGYNAAQRCYDLAFAKAGALVIATAPASKTDAPPGWYRLFALANGVPSIASWIRLT